MILLALAGCLDRLLESPYVLAPGLGEVRSVAARADGQLVVATGTGVYAVDWEGRAERIEDTPADAVSTHPDRLFVLRGGRVTWPGGGVDLPGAVDILGGYDDRLVALYPDALELLDLAAGTRVRLPLGVPDARTVALGPEGAYLVVTEHTLLSIAVDGTIATLARDLVDARAAAVDPKGRVYVAQGDPEDLWRVDGPALTSIARWLGDPRDLHFGFGAHLPPENAYVANGTGTLDYVRPPP
ncbi:MAG: hypothetical protein Q8P41_00825 [Pseudomonadota bacterium]|nr:hypothetical protein [Pseudomonadota bacterium]